MAPNDMGRRPATRETEADATDRHISSSPDPAG
jgi:hypothetical protein